MKQLFSICTVALVLFALSCGPMYNPNASPNFKPNSNYYEVVTVPIVIESDTAYVNEIRFFNIDSALDAKRMLYHHFGKWTTKIEGKYQDNITQMGWENVDLLGDGESYLVFGDGTEQYIEYFTSIMVFDSKNLDCLAAQYPTRDSIIANLATKMKAKDWKKVSSNTVR